MFPAFLSAGLVSPTPLKIKDVSPFYSVLYSEQVKDTMLHFGFTERNTKTLVEMQYDGINYRKRQFVVTKNDNSVELGEIMLILVKDDLALHFLMRLYDGEFLSYIL